MANGSLGKLFPDGACNAAGRFHMAIDPMMYKKYSGRSGDPYDKLGQTLAKSSARQQKLSAKGGSEGPVMFGLKAQWWFSIIASIVAIIVVFSMMV